MAQSCRVDWSEDIEVDAPIDDDSLFGADAKSFQLGREGRRFRRDKVGSLQESKRQPTTARGWGALFIEEYIPTHDADDDWQP